MEYSNSKEMIRESSFLRTEDAQFVDDNIGSFQEAWGKRQIYRTETEMRISVLNDTKFPTVASKYWQCVREQASFYDTLVLTSFAYRRNQLEQEVLTEKIAKCKKPLKAKALRIDLDEAKFAQLSLEAEAADRIRELRLWAMLMAELVHEDPDFDTLDVDTHQLVSYTERFERQLQNVKFATLGEANNLMGQYQTALRRLEKKNPLLYRMKEARAGLTLKAIEA